MNYIMSRYSIAFLVAIPLVRCAVVGRAPRASSFAGSTTTFEFPPPNVTATIPDPNFPVGSILGFAGPTPTGNEAEALATAPAFPKVETAYPLIQPDTADHQGSTFNVFHSWGNLAPWFSVDSSDFGLPSASPLIPEGCGITQAFLLHRHGARYPTGGSAPAAFAAKIHQAAAGAGFTASGPLAFLNDWTYKLGAEILTPFGREQLLELGVGFRVNYGDLLKGFNDLPVFRTTTEARMIDSALNFAAGFFGVQQFAESYHQLIEIEQEGFNSTLQPGNVCPNSGNSIGEFGGVQSSKWSAIFTPPIIKRLSWFITGVNLTTSDIIGMQQACAYETNALGFSSFCDLFTEEEWKQFEYFNDLSFWYGDGPGNPTAAARGIGWVQELVSRLTQTRITDFDSAVNKTIVTSPILFPLDQPIYVDATHDNVLSTIVTALNFTSLTRNGPLPTDHIPADQTWFSSRVAPFSSNLVGQVLSCPASSQPTHIRFLLNDGVLPLTGIQGCAANKDGLCELPSFIAGMQARIAEVDFQFDCFANFTIPIPDNIVDGRFPPALRNMTG
ncbi:phosphoglycerate mutase-like protein [Dentipellis sp. KUC8613]|nr:phosphoglycerate mutase-like protein [Dentipellis sp. KUC8613]